MRNIQTHYSIVKNRITLSSTTYANSDCTGNILSGPVDDPGSFSLQQTIMVNSGVNAVEVDILTDNGLYWYDIWYKSGDSLFHGDYTPQGQPFTVDLRPTDIDYNIEYIKQL
jgi:hypothetical protein